MTKILPQNPSPAPLFLGRFDWISEEGLYKRGYDVGFLHHPYIVIREARVGEQLIFQIKRPVLLATDGKSY